MRGISYDGEDELVEDTASFLYEHLPPLIANNLTSHHNALAIAFALAGALGRQIAMLEAFAGDNRGDLLDRFCSYVREDCVRGRETPWVAPERPN